MSSYVGEKGEGRSMGMRYTSPNRNISMHPTPLAKQIQRAPTLSHIPIPVAAAMSVDSAVSTQATIPGNPAIPANHPPQDDSSSSESEDAVCVEQWTPSDAQKTKYERAVH